MQVSNLPPEGESEWQHSTAVAALVRVAAHHGLTVNPQQLIRAHPFDGKEPNPAELLKVAQSIGLRGKLMRIKPGELPKLTRTVPAILLLPDGKAALINRIEHSSGANVALIDELQSERSISVLYDEPRLFELWAGDVIVLTLRWRLPGAERPFGFAWLIDQLLMERKVIRDVSIAAILMSILALVPPITFMIMLDRVLYNRSFSTLKVLGVVLLVMIGFETVFGYLRRYLIWVTTSRIDARINLHIFDKLLNLPMSFFERVPTGLINAKISQIW
ncbi:MAG: hypothetical protein JO189_15950, partial [Deltaproteobacteria bacterium]|nr:hypothetical protein [Deltaproteobacteria bacterium]